MLKSHSRNVFIRLPELADLIGVSPVTIWRWEKSGSFPRRIKLGPRLVAWDRVEVERWQTERLKTGELPHDQ